MLMMYNGLSLSSLEAPSRNAIRKESPSQKPSNISDSPILTQDQIFLVQPPKIRKLFREVSIGLTIAALQYILITAVPSKVQ